MKVALLSNINIDPVNRLLKSDPNIEIYTSQGYGNELGVLLNKESPLYGFKPETVFILMDVMELIRHELSIPAAEKAIGEWFGMLNSALTDDYVLYLSDAYLYGFELDVVWDKSLKADIERIWNDNLADLMRNHSNVRVFSYSRIVQKLGEDNAFSNKMWYLGKILHSAVLQKSLAAEISHRISVELRQPKKALLLDLDNTMWRGLAGENDITPIVLSEDGVGLAYKNFQRAIKQLKDQGVILGIVSKNNEDDALQIIAGHPHMVLRQDDFAAFRINWENKADNISSIAAELNIGTDSIVFIDDNKAEQELIRASLPEVVVPDFPDRPENLSEFIEEIYHSFFEKTVVTAEDKDKTRQYQANAERKKLQDSAADFDGYLDSLDMKLYREDPVKNKDRLIQLVNKTNQFNLTTVRFTEQEMLGKLEDDNCEIFLYRVTDRFGDNGIVAASMVEYGADAVIEEFTMSCRVMGRKIEDVIVEEMEIAAKKRGYGKLIGKYVPTAKNKPVENLYPSLGYELRRDGEDGATEYVVSLDSLPVRDSHVKKMSEGDL